MKLGIPLGWPDDPQAIGPAVTALAARCDEAGLDSLWTADHLFQIPVTGLPRRVADAGGLRDDRLPRRADAAHPASGVMVTSAVYRHPGMLLKAVTTLDVLSGGRVDFAVGAGWDIEEATALGIPFPPTAERFEHLEERPADRPSDVVGRRVAVRGRAPPAGPSAELAAGPPTAAPADPRGGQWRAQDAPARRRVRRRLQPLRPPGAVRGRHPPQAGRAPGPLRDGRAGSGGDRGHRA